MNERARQPNGHWHDQFPVKENGSHVADTVAHFMERWLSTYCATNTHPRTHQAYRRYIESYIIPTVGNVGLRELSTAHVNDVYSGMARQGLPNRTALRVRRVLKHALQEGVKSGLLIRNVTDDARPPSVSLAQRSKERREELKK